MAIKSSPMSVQAGHEYDAWIKKLTAGIEELIRTGEAPAFAGIDKFLTLSERLRATVKAGADQAARAGEPTFTIEAGFTESEERLLADMGQSLMSYMQVLSLRGKIDPTPSPAVMEAIAAMTP